MWGASCIFLPSGHQALLQWRGAHYLTEEVLHWCTGLTGECICWWCQDPPPLHLHPQGSEVQELKASPWTRVWLKIRPLKHLGGLRESQDPVSHFPDRKEWSPESGCFIKFEVAWLSVEMLEDTPDLLLRYKKKQEAIPSITTTKISDISVQGLCSAPI